MQDEGVYMGEETLPPYSLIEHSTNGGPGGRCYSQADQFVDGRQ